MALLLGAGTVAAREPDLPPRVRQIVLHVLGGPSYEDPDMRFRFRTPQETMSRWRQWRFGTHWILWTDGTLWPRHPLRGQPQAYVVPIGQPLDRVWRERLAREAAPVYGHAYGHNRNSLGIELSHSGRSDDPFPEAQIQSLRWLLGALLEMSAERVTPAAIVGHKDVDLRPAYTGCERPGCPVLVDLDGRPYRRRVDPPESLFVQLGQAGLAIPRPPGNLDAELQRTESLPAGVKPSQTYTLPRSKVRRARRS